MKNRYAHHANTCLSAHIIICVIYVLSAFTLSSTSSAGLFGKEDSKAQFNTTIKVDLRPVIRWRFEENNTNQNIKNFHKTTYSDDSIQGAKSLAFDSSQESFVMIAPTSKTSSHFTQRAFTERTISLWFKPLKANQNEDAKQCLLKIGNFNEGLFLYLEENKLHAQITNSTESTEGQPVTKKLESSYKLNEWNHVVLTYSKGQISLYLNERFADIANIDQAAKFNSTIGISSLGMAFLESDNSRTHPYNGLIDNMQFFDIALDEESVIKLAHNKKIYKNKTITLDGESPLKISTSNTSTFSYSSNNLVQSKRYYIGLGMFVVGILGVFTTLILLFTKSLKRCDQYHSQINDLNSVPTPPVVESCLSDKS